MITVLGATGYTGQLVANELAKLNLPAGSICLAGRSQERLSALAEKLPASAETSVVDVRDPKSLKNLPENTRLIINCAGPFTLFGEEVVRFAASKKIHYLDTTNELKYVYRLQSYHQLAQQNNCAVVPACAFEVALADCTAAILADQTDQPVEKIDVVYGLSNSGSSPGTRQSAIHSLGTSWLAYREGKWVGKVPCTQGKSVQLPWGKIKVISFPSSETAILPRHLEVKEIQTWMAISRKVYLAARVFFPLAAWLARTPLKSVMLQATKLSREKMTDNPPFTILVTADYRGHQGSRSITLTGQGPYELTAKIAVYAAQKILEADPPPNGVLAPSQCLNPREFLAHAEEQWGMQVALDKTDGQPT